MIRHDLTQRLQHAIDALVSDGRLPSGLPRAEIADPRDPAHGDFATNFALVASKPSGKNPRELAEMVREAVTDASVFESIDVAGPGFINFRLTPGYIAGWLTPLLAEGEQLAHAAGRDNPSPKRINVEFVSVNPNGPITIGSGRGAAFGSTLCSVLEAAGNTVHREYYINDGVNSEQMRLFAESVRSLCLGRPVPENGYKGDYVHRVADEVLLWLWRGPNQRRGNPSDAAWHSRIEVWMPQAGKILNASFTQNRDFKKIKEALLTLRLASNAISVHPNLLLAAGFVPHVSKDSVVGKGDASVVLAALALAIYAATTQNVLPDHVKGAYYKSTKRSLDEFAQSVEKVKATQHWQLVARELWFLAHSQRVDGLDQAEQQIMQMPVRSRKNILRDLPLSVFQTASQDLMISAQRRDLHVFGVTFDTWFSEQHLHDVGLVSAEMEYLRNKGVADYANMRRKLILGKSGVLEDVATETQPKVSSKALAPFKPLWLRSTKFGDDQDRVLKRQDGRLTYIASDVAYHKDKFNRPADADKLITILGPDHHGYIGRLHAVVAALEVEPTENPDAKPLTELEAKLYRSPAERDACQAALARSKEKLEVVIFQLVRFMKEGKPAPMRKRDGNIYAIIDLVDEIGRTVKPNASKAEQQEVGKDVARFFYLMRSHDTTFDFDLDLAERQSDENPVFYVQYAHARICSVIAKAAEAGLTAESNPSLIDHPKELALIKMIADLPYEVSRAAEDYGVHRLATYAIDLARAYHHFYDACRVIQPEHPELSRARISLCVATRNALRSVFKLLGISAPERMDREAN